MTQLPPAQPSYILRGHGSQIHALSFTSGNRHLLSGDADGTVIAWDVATKRPVACWRAHEKAILGLCLWPSARSSSSTSTTHIASQDVTDGTGDIITQGRDGIIKLWHLDAARLKPMDTYVTPDQLENAMSKPSKLAEIAVGAVSFCAFATCIAPTDMELASFSTGKADDAGETNTAKAPSSSDTPALLLAAPNAKTSEDIDIFYLPSGSRKSTVLSPKDGKPKLGMLMSVLISAGVEAEARGIRKKEIQADNISMPLTVAAGYECGAVLVYQHQLATDSWAVVYRALPHSQPVLSLCLHPSLEACFSSSADAVVAKHPFVSIDASESVIVSSSSSLASLQRNDGNHDAAVYSGTPLKVIRTKHSGQQGLSMRNDGRIFASAGWDARVRVYSAKSVKELAVLKAHRQGCYATALAEVEVEAEVRPGGGSGDVAGFGAGIIGSAQEDSAAPAPLSSEYGEGLQETDEIYKLEAEVEASQTSAAIVPKKSMAMARYERKVHSTHWLAAGSKDGTISLWDVF